MSFEPDKSVLLLVDLQQRLLPAIADGGGVVTNALAGPFVGPTTVLGLAAALLWWVPFLAAGPGWLAGWCSPIQAGTSTAQRVSR